MSELTYEDLGFDASARHPDWHIAQAKELEAQARGHRDTAANMEKMLREANEKKRMENAPPVDRSATQLTDGAPVPADHSHLTIRPSGQQEGYVVLSDAERAKGFVRPLRDAYRHVGVRPIFPTRPLTPDEETRHGGGDAPYVAFEPYPPGHRGSSLGRFWTQAQLDSGCQAITTMGRSIAETYARDPAFYGGTFCSTCAAHFPVGENGEFTWYEMDGREGPKVGT